MKNSILYIVFFSLLVMGCTKENQPVPEEDFSSYVIPTGSPDIQVIEDEFEGQKIVLAGSGQQNIIVSFLRTNDKGELLEFTAIPNSLPNIMTDQKGNIYNIFGEVVKGEDIGTKLLPTYGFMGYWFSIGTFYEQVFLYGQEEQPPIHSLPEPTNRWLIPQDNLLIASSQDGIPAIDNPIFSEVQKSLGTNSESDLLQDNDLVIGINIDNQIHLYPHKILDWHEIVTDELSGIPFSIIYCPLTGTSNAWSRKIDGKTTTFGVSGMLYNSNIVLYDRQTESLWSQLYGRSVQGEMIGYLPENLQVIEMTWAKWQQMYAFTEAKVLTPNTGFARNYRQYPYGGYRADPTISFPISYRDERLYPKERVHTIVVGNKAKAYRLRHF